VRRGRGYGKALFDQAGDHAPWPQVPRDPWLERQADPPATDRFPDRVLRPGSALRRALVAGVVRERWTLQLARPLPCRDARPARGVRRIAGDRDDRLLGLVEGPPTRPADGDDRPPGAYPGVTHGQLAQARHANY